jgi:cob(I)alamin adenosyltransferase
MMEEARTYGADPERGVLLVLSGRGNGKSSSAFGGMAAGLGQGIRVEVVHFIRRQREIELPVVDGGLPWEWSRDREDVVRAASAAWERALGLLRDPALDLVVLDELNSALEHGYVPLAEVIEAIGGRPPHQHVVITGRAARASH